MGPEIIAAIVTSSTALVAAILSVIISLKTLKLQRKISNSPLQIDYLTRKLIFLENLKKEFIDMDHKVYGNNPASLEKLKEMEAESTNDMLTFLSQTVDKLKGFLFNDKFYNVDNKIQKIKRYNSLLN